MTITLSPIMMPPILLLKRVLELGCIHLRVLQKVIPKASGMVCIYICVCVFSLLEPEQDHFWGIASGEKGRSWLPVLLQGFQGAGSVCPPPLGFTLSFGKARSAFWQVQVGVPDMPALLGRDSMGSGVISGTSDWTCVVESSQCFK